MKTQNLLFAALIVILAYGCGSALNASMNTFTSNSNGWKPADFKPENGVLLIQRVARPKAQQRKMEDYMAKHYPYKYEFIDPKDLGGNSKYDDKKTYRFVLVNSMSQWTVNTTSSRGTGTSTAVVFDFNFIDRPNSKIYPKTGIPSSWASMTFKKVIQACLGK
jgi:hypothetical protein